METAIKFVTAFFNLLTSIFNGGFVATSKRIHFIYDRLGETIDNEALGIYRGKILRIHNGGGNITASKSTYFSVVYEESRKPLPHIRQNYQNVPADRHFMVILQELRLNGFVELIIKDLPDCYLRNFYLSQNITKSKMFFIKESRGGFLWLKTREMHILTLSTIEGQVDFNAPAAAEAITRLVSDVKRSL